MDKKVATYLEIISRISVEYQENSCVMEKLESIITCLPTTIENYNKMLLEKEEKIAQRKRDKTEFKEEFLKTNPYFYVSSMSRFFYYDGLHYTIINEDDIQYNLFTCLSENKSLQRIKYKTQSETIREIKRNRTIMNTIPEGETIEFVTSSLCPLLFVDESMLKYFMIIVGNLILKQHQTYVHFIHPKCKGSMLFVERFVNDTIGVNIADNFKIKYHNHDLAKCRLVKMNTGMDNNSSFCDFFKKNCPDFVSVCCYYSRRYKTEDAYLSKRLNRDTKKYVVYLATNSAIDIVNKFVGSHISMASVENTITSKIMTFMWRWYIHTENIPNVLSVGSLRDALINVLPYDKERDVYTHVSCEFMKHIADFVGFCNTNIVEESDDLDVSELMDIYHDDKQSTLTIERITVDMLLKHGILPYKMKNTKTISGISCLLWKKKDEVVKSIMSYNASKDDNIDLNCYDAYEFYVSGEPKYVANKTYFERIFYNSS
jgi:hypothetical protein